MKYRIREKGHWFYIQKRFLWFCWTNCYNSDFDAPSVLKFCSLEEAQDCIRYNETEDAPAKIH